MLLFKRYDAIVIGILWLCHSKMYILPGTEDMTEAYHDYGYHVRASCVGMLIGLPVCLLIGLVVQVISWIAARVNHIEIWKQSIGSDHSD